MNLEWRSRPVPGDLRVRGFTILEITVVALVVSLVVILAASLMLESTLLSADAMRPITRTHLGLSEAALRQDLSTGRRLGDSVFWSNEPLTLWVEDQRVVYSVEDGFLRRTNTADESVRDLSPLSFLAWRSTGDGTWIQLAPLPSSSESGGRRFVRWPDSMPDAFYVTPRRPRGRGW